MSAAQLFYWGYYFRGLINYKTTFKSHQSVFQPISIIICVKNELANLRKNLPTVVDQDYEEFQLIIADDHSSDESHILLESLRKKWIDKEKRDFLLHKVNQNKIGKKQALKEAIALARHSWLLLTDADCHPKGDKWVKNMINTASSPLTQIILGYSPVKATHTCVSLWAHYEAWLTGLQYLSFAIKKQPYMGVGRNLAYKKELISSDMIDRFGDLASGDDDLTIMQVANGENTAICLDPESFMYSDAPESWSAYFFQKTRHYSTASSYKLSTQLLLAGYSLSHVLFYVAALALVYSGAWPLGIAFYLIRLVVLSPIVISLKEKLEAQFHFLQFVLMDFLQCFYYLIFSFAVLFPQKNKW